MGGVTQCSLQNTVGGMGYGDSLWTGSAHHMGQMLVSGNENSQDENAEMYLAGH